MRFLQKEENRLKSKDFMLCLMVLAIWSSSSSLVSIFMRSSNALVIAGIVISISFFFLSVQLINKARRKFIFSFRLKDYTKLILPAILGLFLYPILYFCGIGGTSPIKANVLNYLWPLIAFITSNVLFKKKIRAIEFCAVLLAAIGGYIVMFSTNMVIKGTVRLDWSEYKYIVMALLGAFFYGIYSAIIEYFTPKIGEKSPYYNSTKCPNNYMPASVRIYIMIFISFILYIPLFIALFLFYPDEIFKSINYIIVNKSSLFAILFYSIVNYTLAHFLWNKVNIGNNISVTSGMAYFIPLSSTIILSYTSDISIGLAPSIGLTLIVFSIIINNRQHLNSINCTFVGFVILTLLSFFTPLFKDTSEIELAKFFLEIIIALFSIYYGFVMNRVISDFKEFEKLIDKLTLYKTQLSSKEQKKFASLEKILLESKKSSPKREHIEFRKTIHKFFSKNLLKKNHDIIECYYLLYRCSNHALETSEWLIIIILSLLIIVLSFIIRNSGLLSNIIAIAIGSTVCLCVSTLYEYELKKSKLLKYF